jgi:hypothetical protein
MTRRLTFGVRATRYVLGESYTFELDIEDWPSPQRANPIDLVHRRTTAMEQTNWDSFNHRQLELAPNRTYHFVDQHPKDYNPVKNPTILCIHGFPDCW